MKTSLKVSLLCVSFLGAAVFAAPPEVATCVACHGKEGKSSIPLYPHLAGQQEAYLKKQLLDFKSGNRKDPVMSAMAKPLSDAQIDIIAKYYSGL